MTPQSSLDLSRGFRWLYVEVEARGYIRTGFNSAPFSQPLVPLFRSIDLFSYLIIKAFLTIKRTKDESTPGGGGTFGLFRDAPAACGGHF